MTPASFVLTSARRVSVPWAGGDGERDCSVSSGIWVRKYLKNLEKGDGSPFSCFGASVVIVGSMRKEERKYERKYGGNERKERGRRKWE
jgi:hypothetical protein